MKNDYEIRGDMVAIFIKRRDGINLETLIDLCDLEKVKALDNCYTIKKKNNTYYAWGYIKLGEKYKKISLHRYLLQPKDNLVIDHFNHDTLDNRRNNLRIVTKAQNSQNLKVSKVNKTGIRGVYWHKASQKWNALIRSKGKPIFDKRFDNIDDAIQAVIKARAELMPFSQEAINN